MPPQVAHRHPRHVFIRTECDICDSQITEEEPFIALLGNANSTGYLTGVPGPAARGEHGRDCLQLFLRNCPARDALDRLWLARVWARQPWSGIPVPPLRLVHDPPAVSRTQVLFDYAARCGLEQLKVLPLELLQMVQALSWPHIFWRYMAALDVATYLSAGPSWPLRSLPLSKIISWERGSKPRLTAAEVGADDHPSVIRLAIDTGGLKTFERLFELPPYQQLQFDNMVFLVVEQSSVANAVALFKFGCLVQPHGTEYRNTVPPCILIRTSLAGDVIVGPYLAFGAGRFLVSGSRPTSLIYSRDQFRRISFISPYSESGQTGALLIDPPTYPGREEFLSNCWYVSSASLDNVTRAHVFLEEDGVYCRGLLLEYANGGQKALGQCRVGVDRCATYTGVPSIAFLNVRRRRLDSPFVWCEGTEVRFGDAPQNDTAWSRHAMTGTLRFWFKLDESRLEIVEPSSNETMAGI
ncbi:hypothetical protein VTH06DRAFT_7394 [Thermothelomyces fergusii]